MRETEKSKERRAESVAASVWLCAQVSWGVLKCPGVCWSVLECVGVVQPLQPLQLSSKARWGSAHTLSTRFGVAARAGGYLSVIEVGHRHKSCRGVGGQRLWELPVIAIDHRDQASRRVGGKRLRELRQRVRATCD